MDGLVVTVITGVVATVLGGAILYMLQRFFDSFKLEQSTKIDNMSSRMRALETSNKDLTKAWNDAMAKLSELNAQIQVLASEQRHLQEAMKDLRTNMRDAETKLLDYGRVIQRGS